MCLGSILLLGLQGVYQSILSIDHVGWHHLILTYFGIVGDAGLSMDFLLIIVNAIIIH